MGFILKNSNSILFYDILKYMKIVYFYKNLLIANWIFIRRVLIWAAVGLVIGMLIPWVFPGTITPFFNFITGIFKQVLPEEEFRATWYTAYVVFEQNFKAALLALFLGGIVGIVPFISITGNFFVVGFMLSSFLKKNIITGLVFVLALLPHGIFEIPALLIGAALGVRLGFFWKLQKPLPLGQKF
jgi:stage II sporulation protein M